MSVLYPLGADGAEVRRQLMCLEDGWGWVMWLGEGARRRCDDYRPGRPPARRRLVSLAVLSAEDEHYEVLRGEHRTTVSK